MSDGKTSFDYQAIIESCGIQDLNVKKLAEAKNEANKKFQEQVDTLRTLTKERDQKKEILAKMRLSLEENLQKLNKLSNKRSTLNQEHRSIQEELLQLELELQQKSDEFINKTNNIDNERKMLYSQFEGETLNNILSDLNNNLLQVKKSKGHLERYFEHLQQSEDDTSSYEGVGVLKGIITDVPNDKEYAELQRKLTNKEKNMQFLSEEYNKKMEMLQKLN